MFRSYFTPVVSSLLLGLSLLLIFSKLFLNLPAGRQGLPAPKIPKVKINQQNLAITLPDPVITASKPYLTEPSLEPAESISKDEISRFEFDRSGHLLPTDEGYYQFSGLVVIDTAASRLLVLIDLLPADLKPDETYGLLVNPENSKVVQLGSLHPTAGYQGHYLSTRPDLTSFSYYLLVSSGRILAAAYVTSSPPKSVSSSKLVDFQTRSFDQSKDKTRIIYFTSPSCLICRLVEKDLSKRQNLLSSDVLLYKADFDKEIDKRQRLVITNPNIYAVLDSRGRTIAKWQGGGINEIVERLKLITAL